MFRPAQRYAEAREGIVLISFGDEHLWTMIRRPANKLLIHTFAYLRVPSRDASTRERPDGADALQKIGQQEPPVRRNPVHRSRFAVWRSRQLRDFCLLPSASCLLSSEFCLLNSVFCILYSVF
jgi:hypothetical protein